MQPLVQLDGVSKAFTLHLHEGVRLDVVSGVTFSAAPGECVVLGGPSGAGKSSLLKIVYGNYSCDAGHIWIRDGGERIDVAAAEPRPFTDVQGKFSDPSADERDSSDFAEG